MDELLSEEKADIAASLVVISPPLETDQVTKDIKVLVGGPNELIDKKLAKALLIYAKEQTIQVNLPGSLYNTLITECGELNNGRFLCPRTLNSFSFDPFTLKVDNIQKVNPDGGEAGNRELEQWRLAIETCLTMYIGQHFQNGAVSVFAPVKPNNQLIVVYIESSYSKHVSTGRWRSCWKINFPEKYKKMNLNITGTTKLQTHVYEEGNVQLLSQRKFEFELPASSPEKFASQLSAKIMEADSAYQMAIGQNLDTMSNTSFKALRRQLPMTHSKIEWNKIAAYQVGNEINRSN